MSDDEAPVEIPSSRSSAPPEIEQIKIKKVRSRKNRANTQKLFSGPSPSSKHEIPDLPQSVLDQLNDHEEDDDADDENDNNNKSRNKSKNKHILDDDIRERRKKRKNTLDSDDDTEDALNRQYDEETNNNNNDDDNDDDDEEADGAFDSSLSIDELMKLAKEAKLKAKLSSSSSSSSASASAPASASSQKPRRHRYVNHTAAYRAQEENLKELMTKHALDPTTKTRQVDGLTVVVSTPFSIDSVGSVRSRAALSLSDLMKSRGQKGLPVVRAPLRKGKKVMKIRTETNRSANENAGARNKKTRH